MAIDVNDPEFKAAIKQAADDAAAPLVAKNKELLGELKQARQGRTIEPAELEKLEQKNDDLQKALHASEKIAKNAVAEAEKAGKSLSAELENGKSLAIDNGLSSAIAKANVAPHFSDAVKAMLKGKTSLDDDRNVVVGDKSLNDFMAEWSQGDEGKHYIVAPNNSGGGAGGSGGEGGAKTMTRSDFDSKSQTERMAFTKDGGKITD